MQNSKAKKDILKVIDGFVPDIETDNVGTIHTDRYKTGVESLDDLLGGGLPKSKIVSLATVEGGGKTTLAIQIGGNIIETYDKEVYFMDVEGGATTELINAMGYGMHLYHPKTNPTGKFKRLDLEFIQDIARVLKLIYNDPNVGLVILDSTTLVADKLDLEDEELGMSNKAVGSHARMWSKASRQLNALIKRSPAAYFFIHQVRENLSGFRVQTEAARGRALKHLTSVEIFGTVGKWIDGDGDEVTSRDVAKGAVLRLTTNKNRLTAPYAKVQMPLFYGKGVSNKWAYREWLENVDITDTATGEVVKALHIKGGGYATLTLPSGSYNLRGKVEINAAVDTHINEILALIEERGGLRLDQQLPPDEYDFDFDGESETDINDFIK